MQTSTWPLVPYEHALPQRAVGISQGTWVDRQTIGPPSPKKRQNKHHLPPEVALLVEWNLNMQNKNIQGDKGIY